MYLRGELLSSTLSFCKQKLKCDNFILLKAMLNTASFSRTSVVKQVSVGDSSM